MTSELIESMRLADISDIGQQQALHSLKSRCFNMGPSGPTPYAVRFGLFEFDPRSGELRKQGRKVRLEGQPVQILIKLLNRPGELVTREELQRELWPSDTFVNFEQSLNAAVKRLRHALGDSPDNSRFVETLARRGHRFIAPVSYPADAPVSQQAPSPAGGSWAALPFEHAETNRGAADLRVGAT